MKSLPSLFFYFLYILQFYVTKIYESNGNTNPNNQNSRRKKSFIKHYVIIRRPMILFPERGEKILQSFLSILIYISSYIIALVAS